MEEKLWFWVPEWPTAFPECNGVRELLQLGYYMLHIDVLGMYANDEALDIMRSLYDFVRHFGFARKGALIGMSYGGLYSFRYAQKYPETVACIYADAPVCDLYFRPDMEASEALKLCSAYGIDGCIEKLINHPLAPVNNYLPIVQANISLLLILGMSDSVVKPETNGLLLAERWKQAGGQVEMIKRPGWGHHPHGLNNPAKIVRFILRNTFNKNL